MQYSRFWCAVTFVATLALQTARADEPSWSRFRGPAGAGTAVDMDIPVKLSEQTALWKKELPGPGNSSPVIWGDKLFLQSASKDGTKRMLVCLNCLDGKTIWVKDLPIKSNAVPRTHPKNTLASSTPAVDGAHVFVLVWDGLEVQLQALDFEGKSLWSRDLGEFKSQHGPGSSPIAYKNKVFVAFDQDGAAEVLAFDSASGKELWRASREPFRACYSVPFMLEKAGTPAQLIVGSTAGVTSYDPDAGSVNWDFTSWPWLKTPLRTVASPIVANGLIVANSGDGSGERNTVAFRPDGRGKLDNTAVLWSKTKMYPYVPNLLAQGEHLYFVNDAGIAGCAVAKTGEIVWSQRLAGNFSSSPVLIDGKVYAVSETGATFVFQAAPKYQLLGKSSIDEGVIASPAVARRRLYIRGRDSLYCFGDVSSKAD
ncbi:PQQ-like beta-propeller repeat protein [soil metagenome]